MTTGFKEVTSRVTDTSKYVFIHALAKQGFLAKDIVNLVPSSISVSDGKTLVKSEGKTAEFTLADSKVIAKYLNTNHSHIKEYNLVFFGKGQLSVEGITKAFRTYLKKIGSEDTLTSLGWTSTHTAFPSFSFESLDDMQKLLDSLKVAEPPKEPRKPKKTVE